MSILWTARPLEERYDKCANGVKIALICIRAMKESEGNEKTTEISGKARKSAV